MLAKFLESRAAATTTVERDSKQRGEAPRMFLERLDTEEFDSGRLVAHF